MALTKERKADIVGEVSQLLSESKMTVLASYPGTSVKAMQSLRHDAKEGQTKVKVYKNRLVIKALAADERWKNVDTAAIKGQLLYAFNAVDEVAPAQALATFAKNNPTLEFVGAISADGQFISSDDVKALAALPSKDQLRAQLVGTLSAPLSGFINVLSGNVRGVLNVLQARAEALGN